MGRNNKGFSLVELIVALAIFAIAGVAVFGFMVNSSRLYQRTNVEVKLQYEQQLAVNQIRDMVVESDRGIYFADDGTSKTLALYGAAKKEGASVVYPVTVVKYVVSEQKMYYGTKSFSLLSDVSYSSVDTTKLLAENVKEFEVDLSKVKKDKVEFKVTFIVGDKEQTALETVALRNRLIVSNEVDTIWGDVPEVVDSFIREITICRDGKEFENNEQDTIGKADGSVIVVYTAKIIANEDSEREYHVAWSLSPAVNGVSVDTQGRVTVTTDAPVSSVVHLKATSVDDPSKYAQIDILITDTAVYPTDMSLSLGDVTDGNGFRTYKLLPALFYSDGSSLTDYNLFTWDVPDDMPGGGTFNKETGVLTLGPGANGKAITITAKAKARKADGTLLSKDITIDVSGITEYVPGPGVKIICAKELSRGGYVFPNIVLENASHSNYSYDWKIEPYADEESDLFTNSDEWNDNSRFKLVSLAVSGAYNGNVNHTMQTNANRRSVTVNCSPQLDWKKTFKIKVSCTATDKNSGDQLVATPIVVTVKPVTLTITRYGGEDVETADKRPVLTSSALRYEDWYWDGVEEGSEDGKWKYTRRWFNLAFENISINGSSTQNTTLIPNYVFMDATGVLLENANVGNPQGSYQDTKLLCGFKQQMINWERCNPRPAYLNYSVTVKDNYGNSITSNTEEFYMEYVFVNPTTVSGE